MKKYTLSTWFEQEVYFEVEANSKKEAIEKAENGIGERNWQRGSRRGNWQVEVL